MGNYNPVYKNIWSDPKFEKLNVPEKLVYLYLITNEKTQQTGFYQIRTNQISCDCGPTIEEVKNALAHLEKIGLIKYWPEQNQIFIYNHFKIAKGMIKNPMTLTNCIKRQRELINNPEAWDLFDKSYKTELDAINEALIKNQTNKNSNQNVYKDMNSDLDNNINQSKVRSLEEIVNSVK